MKEHLFNTIKNSEAYTLAVAGAMPENGYSVQPVNTVWNFAELMNHIAYGIEWWTKNYVRKEETPWQPPAPKKSKREIVLYIEQAYSFLKDSMNNGTVTEEKRNGLYATLDHITHHRGQATTYLRFNGITPPEYSY